MTGEDPVRLDQLPGDGGPGGVIWSAPPSGLNVNLVELPPDGTVGRHVNGEIDVLVVVLGGGGTIEVDAETHEVEPTTALLIRRGAARSVAAGPAGIRYLTTHVARGPLTIRPGPAADRAGP